MNSYDGWGSDYEWVDQNEDGKYDEIEAQIYEEWTRNLGPPPEIERVSSPFDAGEIYDPGDVAGEDEGGSYSDAEGSDMSYGISGVPKAHTNWIYTLSTDHADDSRSCRRCRILGLEVSIFVLQIFIIH